ncbi:fimbrial protein [Nitratireductor mangrovi]|uniref:Fimbrial protein n=1 Tax=Nitratireductor mangrovi TaxID=2599600 RepID=A0A5B8KWK8_9HYPH|nr:fimbrial protein [Nitratireductor mangrovi]QDY99955.1 fimbrial protein [Nitratireductor mangrovi]
MDRPNISADDLDEKPLDPAAEKVRRRLVRFIAINLGILFVAVMAVLAAVVYKVGLTDDGGPSDGAGVPSPAETPFVEKTIALPTGATVLSQAVSGHRLSLHVRLAGGGEAVFVYDTAEGRMTGRFDLVSE